MTFSRMSTGCAYEQDKKDCFEALVEWIEMKARIMDEAKEETSNNSKAGTKPEMKKN